MESGEKRTTCELLMDESENWELLWDDPEAVSAIRELAPLDEMAAPPPLPDDMRPRGEPSRAARTPGGKVHAPQTRSALPPPSPYALVQGRDVPRMAMLAPAPLPRSMPLPLMNPSNAQQASMPPACPATSKAFRKLTRLRGLTLGLGVLLGATLCSVVFAAVDKPAAGLRMAESVAAPPASAATETWQTADFELRPQAAAPTKPTKKPRSTAKRVSPAQKPAPAASSVSAAAAFRQLQGRLRTCAAGQSGTARLEMTVLPSGMISHATVYGRFEGPQGSCMATAARGLYLPASEGPMRRIDRTFSW